MIVRFAWFLVYVLPLTLAGVMPLLPVFNSPSAALEAKHAETKQAEEALAGLKLPPPTGPATPRLMPTKGDDGLYHHEWFTDSFLNLKEDWEEAKAEGKRLAIFIEQRGCSYCEQIQKEILSQKYIRDYIKNNFRVIQLNLWGERKVIDFDGKELPEKEAARRWGILFTPTILLFTDDSTGKIGKPAPAWTVASMPGAFKKNTFYDMFVWVGSGAHKVMPNFQAFHINRIKARQKLRAAQKR